MGGLFVVDEVDYKVVCGHVADLVLGFGYAAELGAGDPQVRCAAAALGWLSFEVGCSQPQTNQQRHNICGPVKLPLAGWQLQ